MSQSINTSNAISLYANCTLINIDNNIDNKGVTSKVYKMKRIERIINE